MDDATAWLKANDPDYHITRRAWCDLDDNGEYVPPRNELPFGTAADIGNLLERGTARPVTPASARYCRQCDTPFVAYTDLHTYCSDACYQQARPKRKRDRADYMRTYRATKRAPK